MENHSTLRTCGFGCFRVSWLNFADEFSRLNIPADPDASGFAAWLARGDSLGSALGNDIFLISHGRDAQRNVLRFVLADIVRFVRLEILETPLDGAQIINAGRQRSETEFALRVRGGHRRFAGLAFGHDDRS